MYTHYNLPSNYLYDYPNGYLQPYSYRTTNATTCINLQELALSNELRLLWEDHVNWTRMVINSIVEGLADEDVAVKRLLRNATDMGQVFTRYYGEPIGKHFEKLIHDHLTIAAMLVHAAKVGETEKAAKLEKDWYANADDIAAFLHQINPHYWSKSEWQRMLYEHLRLTKDEAVTRIKKDYVANAALYDKIRDQAMEMADMLSMGLIQQFHI